MVNLICENCSFRFKRQEITKTCPYCNKKAVFEESSAEEIVGEVESLLRE